MFRVPSFYEDFPSFTDAAATIKGRGNGDLLAGMESMNSHWAEHWPHQMPRMTTSLITGLMK